MMTMIDPITGVARPIAEHKATDGCEYGAQPEVAMQIRGATPHPDKYNPLTIGRTHGNG